jgi:hypothetical protein
MSKFKVSVQASDDGRLLNLLIVCLCTSDDGRA